jgi:hypothetical protein
MVVGAHLDGSEERIVTVVGYTHRQASGLEEGGATPDEQARILEVWAERNGHQLLEVVHGSGPGHSGMVRALGMCVSGAADGIVIDRLDRLGDLIKQEAYLKQLLKRTKVFVVDPDDERIVQGRTTDPRRVLIAEVLARRTEIDAVERTLSNLEQRRDLIKQNRHWRNHAHPYGWRWGTKGLVPHKDEGAAIMWMMELREAGVSYRAIADTLNQAGVPARHGGLWKGGSVTYILRRDHAALVEQLSDTVEAEDVVEKPADVGLIQL